MHGLSEGIRDSPFGARENSVMAGLSGKDSGRKTVPSGVVLVTLTVALSLALSVFGFE